MTRKIISAFLSIALIAGFILPCLSGCKASSDATHYTVMEWLDNVELTFNLLYYSEEEPLVNSVKTSDEGFDTVQIAAEWGIIDPADELDFGGRLSKELAADTLIRAMNCVTPSSAEMSDSGSVKPQYLENVMSSVNEGIFALDGNRFDPKKQLTKAEADSAMLAAYDKWINFSYGESFDRSTLKENVINLGGVASENSKPIEADYKVEYTGSRTFFDEGGGYTDNTTKTITFPADGVPMELKEGSVLAMPADDVVPMDYAVVVTGVDFAPDGSVTVSTRNAELEEVFEEIDTQYSGPVDFSKAKFYGPDGERLYFEGKEYEDMSLMSGEYEAEPLGLYVPRENETLQTKSENSSKVKLGEGITMTLIGPAPGSLGFGIKFEGEINDKKTGENLSIELGFSDNVSLEHRFKTHWDWFKLKVDQMKVLLKDTRTETAGYTCSAVKNFGKLNNKYGNDDGKWDIGTDWAKDAHILRKLYSDTRTAGQSFKSISAKANSATNKKLLDIVVGGGWHFVVRSQLSVDGSMKLVLTQSNTAGVELIKGKLRFIKEKSNSQELDFSAKAELTFRIGLEYQILSINVMDLGITAGIGAKASSKISSYDKASDTLLEICGVEGAVVNQGGTINASDDVKIDQTALPIPEYETRRNVICNELRVYPILKISACSKSSVVGKVIGGVEVEVFGEKTPFLTVHYEHDKNGGGIVSECSITANENYGIVTGEKLLLNMSEYSVSVGEEADTGLAVISLPADSTIKDINISSDNTEVLEVENLLHKTTVNGSPSAKFKVNVNLLGGTVNMKDLQSYAKELVSQYTDSWFYEDLSGSAKPQFALTGKKNGTANVTITANGESVTIPVKVGTGDEPIVSTGALTTTKSTYTLVSGETAQTTFEFIPEGRTIADISFESADTSVAKVSKGGLILAVGVGNTTITATLHGADKDYSETFTVHVVG